MTGFHRCSSGHGSLGDAARGISKQAILAVVEHVLHPCGYFIIQINQ
jgi:hypothetical protein